MECACDSQHSGTFETNTVSCCHGSCVRLSCLLQDYAPERITVTMTTPMHCVATVPCAVCCFGVTPVIYLLYPGLPAHRITQPSHYYLEWSDPTSFSLSSLHLSIPPSHSPAAHPTVSSPFGGSRCPLPALVSGVPGPSDGQPAAGAALSLSDRPTRPFSYCPSGHGGTAAETNFRKGDFQFRCRSACTKVYVNI